MPNSARAAAKIVKRVRQLGRLGPWGLARTCFVSAVAKPLYGATDPLLELPRRLHRLRVRRRSLAERIAVLQRRLRTEADPGAAPLLKDVDPALDQLVHGDRGAAAELVLGEFDQDGDLLFRDDLRAVTSLPVTEEKSFCRRKKHRLLLVDVEGRLGVRKEFGDARGRLVQELEALLDLRAHGCAVPAVISADWQANSVTMTYVPGRVLRELLAEAGAKVRDRGNGDAAAGLPQEQRVRSARALLDRVLTDEQVEAIASEMLAIHRAGYVLEDVKYGNIVIQSSNGAPFFIDFERALPISGLPSRLAAYLRDVDRRKFNAHFGTDLQTAKTLRSLAAPPSALDAGGGNGRAEGVYAPAIIRPDIHWGPLWNTDVGIGRWNFIMKDHLPIPRGGSVLDLGANNGFNALQMLRSGAGSAVGVEIDPRAIRQGEFLKQAVEWADNLRYDFSYIEGSHAELPKHGLGRFDLVTALCTLYYVSEQEMRDTVQFLRTITNLVVLQCNTDRLIERSTESTFRKASVEFSLDLLASAGFSRTEVVAPPHYSRPLVIGRSS